MPTHILWFGEKQTQWPPYHLYLSSKNLKVTMSQPDFLISKPVPLQAFLISAGVISSFRGLKPKDLKSSLTCFSHTLLGPIGKSCLPYIKIYPDLPTSHRFYHHHTGPSQPVPLVWIIAVVSRVVSLLPALSPTVHAQEGSNRMVLSTWRMCHSSVQTSNDFYLIRCKSKVLIRTYKVLNG